MADKTGIEWTDATWNPIRGCSRVSEGCRNCYAERVAYRFSDKGRAYEGLVGIGGRWNGQIRFVEEHLLDPLTWRTPRRIFVNSMSDLFHENVTDEMRDRIFAVMALCPQHTFQVLTKRARRALEYLKNPLRWRCVTAERVIESGEGNVGAATAALVEGWPLKNVWLGVSVENQKAADERIPLLLQTPAAVRFLSCEPVLGPMNLAEWTLSDAGRVCRRELGGRDLPNLDWVIVGGESGPGARPMHPDWARSLRDQCTAAGVPFFFKQWGEWLPLSDYDPFVLGADPNGKYRHEFAYRAGVKNSDELPISCYRVGKKAAGHLLDGREWHEFPERAA